MKSLADIGPVISVSSLSGAVLSVMPRVSARKVLERLAFGGIRVELALAARVEVELRPLRALERPLVLLAQFHLVGERTAQVQPHAGFLLPAVLLAFQVVVEEALLEFHAVFEVEPLLVPARMAFEPFFF